MQLIKNILFILTLFCGVTLSGCAEDKEEVELIPEKSEPIGTYKLGEETVDIMQGVYQENDFYYCFRFTPLVNKEPPSTYILFYMAKELDGIEKNVDYISHNFDYVFVYEDPVYLYPSFKKLNSGTLYVKKTADDYFDINIEVELYDGKPFDMNFSGKLLSQNFIE